MVMFNISYKRDEYISIIVIITMTIVTSYHAHTLPTAAIVAYFVAFRGSPDESETLA